MLRITSITALAIILISLLAACSSSSVGPYRSYDSHSYYTYRPYNPYSSYKSYSLLQPAKPAVRITGLFSTRTIPGTFEDIKQITDTCARALDPLEYDIEYTQIGLYPELTVVGGEYFSLASTNVTYDPENEDPTIRLASTADRVSIAIYHFGEIEAGRTIGSISIDNKSRFYGLENHGFFMGYRHDEGEEYKWYGPFGVDDSWLLPLTPRLTYKPTSPSLVIATTQGDILDLRSFTVSEERYTAAYADWQISRAEYEARLYELERERYWNQLEELRLYEEWQRLEYEYYVLRERELALKYERRRHDRDQRYRHHDRDDYRDRDRRRDDDDGWERGEVDADSGSQDGTLEGRRFEVTERGHRLSLDYDL
jgi:hypothetical protein